MDPNAKQKCRISRHLSLDGKNSQLRTGLKNNPHSIRTKTSVFKTQEPIQIYVGQSTKTFSK